MGIYVGKHLGVQVRFAASSVATVARLKPMAAGTHVSVCVLRITVQVEKSPEKFIFLEFIG